MAKAEGGRKEGRSRKKMRKKKREGKETKKRTKRDKGVKDSRRMGDLEQERRSSKIGNTSKEVGSRMVPLVDPSLWQESE